MSEVPLYSKSTQPISNVKRGTLVVWASTKASTPRRGPVSDYKLCENWVLDGPDPGEKGSKGRNWPGPGPHKLRPLRNLMPQPRTQR